MKRILLSIVMILAAAGLFAQQYSRDLKYVKKTRMFGEDVIFVQQKLLAAGIDEAGEADGWFGENTQLAVETFQHLFGFPVTGEVNSELYEFLGTYETEAGLGKFIAGVKTACYAKYRKHHLIKSLADTGLSAEGGLITAYYDNKNGGTVPVMAIQELYDQNGRVKNTIYPLGKDSYIYTVLKEYYSGGESVETISYFVDEKKAYILQNGKLESSGITEELAVNPAHILARLKSGR